MRGFVNLELEFFIMYLILPEILRFSPETKQQRTNYKK